MVNPNSSHEVRQLNLAFIGGGLSSAIGPAHRAACQMDGRWKLVAGSFSRNKELSLATAEEWNISPERTYTDWRDLIATEKDRLDAVVVLAPPDNHLEILCKLLDQGIPIISEKPLVATLDDAMALKQKWQSSPGFLAVTYNYSGYPMVRELRERVRCGELGEIVNLQFEMPQEGFMRLDPGTGKPVRPQEWRLRDGDVPTICLDLGVHLHHLTHFITGKNIRKTASIFSNHSPHEDVVDDIMMWVELDDGCRGGFWMSKSALGHRNGLRLRVFGTEASAEWFQAAPEEMQLNYRDGARIKLDRASPNFVCSEPRYNRYRAGHPDGFIEAFANLYADIADALIEYRESDTRNSAFVFGLDQSIAGLELFSAAVEANRSGRWEPVGNSSFGD